MTGLAIAGGVYEETCLWPEWNDIYGSGGRAAAALMKHVDQIILHTYLSQSTKEKFLFYANAYDFKIENILSDVIIGFHYLHALSEPFVTPSFNQIVQQPPLIVESDAVLRFGMLEGSAIVKAKKCVYDPQQPDNPESFDANGSACEELIIVGNVNEIRKLGGADDLNAAAASLLRRSCQAVIAKGAASGATVFSEDGIVSLPAFQSDFVWTIGSGDIFSANFAANWAVKGVSPADAGLIASRAVAEYAATQTLPTSAVADLELMPFKEAYRRHNRVYLAGPFFTIGQRLFIDSARACLIDLGFEVFSPVHDVGIGLPTKVATADLKGLDKCDAVFAVADGLDAGTIFEIGYARAKEKPVYVLSQTVSERDLAMMIGSRCRVFTDFVTAAYHMAWGA